MHGCKSPGPAVPGEQPVNQAKPAAAGDQVIARLNGRPITLAQLQKPLLEGHGLNVLLNLVQLEMARQRVAAAGLTVSDQDVEQERQLTLSKLFQEADKSEYDQLFEQFLQQQHITKTEFDLVIQTNACLRKLAEPLVKDKITEASLQEAFRQLYGETVQVRHIQLANMQEVLEAKRRLASGEPFEKVAREMSRNARTAELGGELPPFSRQAAYPQAMKDTAFSLKEGEVSDAVMFEGAYHLIKLERRIAPKAVKFEDVKDGLRQDLHERLVQATMKQLRTEISADAIRGLAIDDPMLKEQYEDKLRRRDQQIRDRQQILQQLEKERQRILQRAATQQSATEPVIESADQPFPEAERPPAAQDGETAR